MANPSYIYIHDYFAGTYDYVSLYDTGYGYSYGYDDQGNVIYYGGSYSSPSYIYDSGEGTYFYSYNGGNDGAIYYDYTPNFTVPSYIYIYDYYAGTYDYVSLYNTGYNYAYGYDEQGQTIYYGASYSSPSYVYDAGEGTYFYSYSSQTYDGMIYFDYTINATLPSYIYIYDYYAGTYDYVSLYNTGYGYAYGYDDDSQVIYYGSSYSSPSYVYDSGENAYFYSDNGGYNGSVYYDASYIAIVAPSYIYIYDYTNHSYDYVSLTDTGHSFAYGYDDQGHAIYYGSSYGSPSYVYDAGEDTYFSSFVSTAYDGMVFYDFTTNVTVPSYIYICDYYAGTYDYVSLSSLGSGHAYGYDDQGNTIYYGSSYYSPNYVYDSGEGAYFSSNGSTAYDGMVFYDYTTNLTAPSYIYICDYYANTYDYVSLTDTGNGYAYGYDDQNNLIYYGSSYSSPNYVYDADEDAYFGSNSTFGYDGMVFYDYTNFTAPSYIYIYDYYAGIYDYVSLYNTGYGYAYGYDDQGQLIYYGSSYSSPAYVYDAGENAYFASASGGSDGSVYDDFTSNITIPSYIYIYDYYIGTYDYVSLTDTGTGYAYGYDDQGQTIYFGASFSSPSYVYDYGENTYFYSYGSSAYDGMVFYDYSANIPSYIYIYDYYDGSYDYVGLSNTGYGYAYGYDDQGNTIYYGGNYASPNYVYDAGEGTYFYSYGSIAYDGMVFYDYTTNVTVPSYIYIYDYTNQVYDMVSLTSTGSGYAYGYDDDGQAIYYGSGYGSPSYVYDSGEGTYFYAYDGGGFDGAVYYDYTSSMVASYLYYYQFAYSNGDMFWGYWYGEYGEFAAGEAIVVYDENGGYAFGMVTSVSYAGFSHNAIGDDYIYSYYDVETASCYTPYYYSQGLPSTAADIGSTLNSGYDYVYINGGWEGFGWDQSYQVLREAN